MLNKSKGNMYSFVTHTWNTIKGRCPHDCHYCYMKRWGKQRDIYFDKKELKTDLGTGNFIFVGSSCDMWADGVPKKWIDDTLALCRASGNRILIQTKNPMNIQITKPQLSSIFTVGTTIETNRIYPQMGKTPTPWNRAASMNELRKEFVTMVTIEPIMNFDTDLLLRMISMCQPKWVNIGADSGGHKLPEPPAGKVRELIAELSKFTVVIPKKNLNRILKGEG